MAQQPFKADKLLIGKQSNIIEKSPQGDMMFRDSFVEGVTLKDLLGGTVVISPAIVVTVEESDWVKSTIDGQLRYTVEVPHPWADLCDPKVNINIWDSEDVEITINKIQFKTTSILLETTVRIDVQVVLKRL